MFDSYTKTQIRSEREKEEESVSENGRNRLVKDEI